MSCNMTFSMLCDTTDTKIKITLIPPIALLHSLGQDDQKGVQCDFLVM